MSTKVPDESGKRTPENATDPELHPPIPRPQGNKRKFPHTQEQNANSSKRPRFNAYNKSTPSTTLASEGSSFLSPIKRYFLVQVSLAGLETIARTCYRMLNARDNRVVAHHFTEDQFVHISYFAAVTRLYRMAELLGLTTTEQLPHLDKDVRNCSSLLFPEIICQYVESLGLITMNYAHVAPYVKSPADFFEDQTIMFTLNGFGTRNVNAPCNINNYRHAFPVSIYVLQIVRARTVAHGWRSIKYDEYGTHDLIVSFKTDPDENECIIPYSPISLAESTAKRGATFRFWNEEEFREEGHHNQFPSKFRGSSFDCSVYMTTLISQSMVPLK